MIAGLNDIAERFKIRIILTQKIKLEGLQSFCFMSGIVLRVLEELHNGVKRVFKCTFCGKFHQTTADGIKSIFPDFRIICMLLQ